MKSAFLFYKLPIFLIGLSSFSDICQKLSADVKQREWLVACCTHKVCIQLNPAPQATTQIKVQRVSGDLQEMVA